MEKKRWEELEKRKEEERRLEKRKSQKKENTSARKGRRVTKHCVFLMLCGPGGSKSSAAVARSTCGSQNVKDTSASEKLRCSKTARRCGAKHAWK